MPDTEWSNGKRARVEAARRPRRIIVNDDTHELALEDASTPEGFLGHRITPMAGTQVGAVAWSVLCGQFDAPAYDSKVQPIYGDAHGGPVKYWQKVTENVKTLARDHRCPLHLVTDFAHAHDMESFASVRMNDVHDSFMDANAMTVWKRTHPEFLVDTRGMLPGMEVYATSQDFSHPAVRERKLEIIGEICERHDVDGFELDYIRHPVLFSRRVRGEPCTEEEIGIITAMMRQIRDLTEAASARRGRPMLIAARVPDTFAACLDNGMDARAWLEQDLIDIVIAGGGYAPWLLPVAEWAEAAHPHGVPVYPCVNAGKDSLPMVRAMASNWYGAGADGLYFWNLGTPFEFMTGEELEETRRDCYACLDEVGDPALVRGKEKLFCADNIGGSVLTYYALASSPRVLPIESKHGNLRTGVFGRVPITAGDDVFVEPPARATLSIEFDDPAWQEALLVRLNGEELAGGSFAPAVGGRTGSRLAYPVSVPTLKTGRNFVELAARNDLDLPDHVVTVTAVELRVEYGP